MKKELNFENDKIFILFEDRINKDRNFLFTNPVDKLTSENKHEFGLTVLKIDEYRKKNKFIAGYLGYEYQSEFYVFETVLKIKSEELDNFFKGLKKKTYIYDFKTGISKEEYFNSLKRLKNYIKDGETYQANFTFKANFKFTEKPLILYKSLREEQRVEYGAYLNLDDKVIISLSPELFFRKNGNIIISKPMKGTLKNDNKKSESYHIEKMLNDEKIISENLMILDLIRNDISKIANPRSVEVKKPFEIQKFRTLYQMISTVKAKLSNNISFGDITEALFPCGSITGAPKKRTMEIIKELEKEKRGIYTGIIGFITPDNDMIFNIAIRTITIDKKEGFKAKIGIGGGILYDSDIESEWNEALLKAEFIKKLNDDLIILDTRAEKGGIIEYEDLHIKRLNKSLKVFGINKTRVRILKAVKVLSIPLITVSKEKIDHNSIFRKHKTNKREIYDSEYEKIKDKYKDIIFFNIEGNLAEASRHNVYIEKNGKIFTPFVKDGALPGIIREVLLKENKVSEKTITKDEFFRADKIYLSNSLNVFFEVRL